MNILTFQAIRFNNNFWTSKSVFKLNNSDTKTKIQNTCHIMNLIKDSISNEVANIDKIPGLYVLRISNGMKSVILIIGEVDHNKETLLLPNEEIHPEKLEFYKRIFKQYRIQANPILTFYKKTKDVLPIKSIVSDVILSKPSLSVKTGNTLYELWNVIDMYEINEINNRMLMIRRLYIADGHHRFAILNNDLYNKSSRLVVAITDSESILLKSCHRVIVGDINNNWKDIITNYADLKDVKNRNRINSSILLKFKSDDEYQLIIKSNANIHNIIKEKIIQNTFCIDNITNKVYSIPGSISVNDYKKIFNLYKDSSLIIFVPDITVEEFVSTIESGIRFPPTSTWFEPKIIDGFIIKKY